MLVTVTARRLTTIASRLACAAGAPDFGNECCCAVGSPHARGIWRHLVHALPSCAFMGFTAQRGTLRQQNSQQHFHLCCRSGPAWPADRKVTSWRHDCWHRNSAHQALAARAYEPVTLGDPAGSPVRALTAEQLLAALRGALNSAPAHSTDLAGQMMGVSESGRSRGHH